MQPVTIQNFPTALACQIDKLTQAIQDMPRMQNATGVELNYTQTIRAIHDMTLCLFKKIADYATKAGFDDVNLLEAWPKGLCENFVCATVVDSKITEVILTKNNKWGFYQNGGGKTLDNETSRQAAHREAQEELNFPGQIHQVKRITIESESGDPQFHFVKGVWMCFVTPEQANLVKPGDDIQDSTLVRLPTEEFLKITDEDKTPYDHGFDRKWMAQYVREMNESKPLAEDMCYNTREISEADTAMANKAREWMRQVRVRKDELANYEMLITLFSVNLVQPEAKAQGKWRSDENRKVVQESAQKMVNKLVEKFLPAWTYITKKGEQTVRQIKVQDAVGFLVNGEPLPSFLTISQFVKVQDDDVRKYRMESLSNQGHGRDLTTVRLF